MPFAGGVVAGDWPAFRHDNHRSGATDGDLQFPLRPVWTHRPLQPPAPAWPEPAATNYAVMHGPLHPTLTFDRAHHAVADSSSVYYGSSGDDSVCAIDAASGRLRWRYVTEGPVRLPPVLWNGAVLAGSDDGCLYSLDAATGALRWRRRVAPEDRRLPGNGRMISLWPVRGGLVVENGTLHASAGLFPEHGVHLGAFDAATGEPRRMENLPFTSQGTMLATADRLFLSTGRTAYWTCDLESGRPLVRHGTSNPWQSNLVGGCFAVLADGVLATGPSEDGRIHWFQPMSKDPVLAARGDCLIVERDVAYLLGQGRIQALPRAGLPGSGAVRRLPEPLWTAPADGATTMIRAGAALVAGGPGHVTAFAVGDGRRLFSARVDGAVEGLAAAHGRLFVSLANGDLLGFAAGGPSEPAAPPLSAPVPDSDPAIAAAAAEAVAFASSSNGYCLVLQSGTGRLALEIARRSAYRIVCREEDPAEVSASRDLLARAGVYGSRVVVHQGGAADLPYPRGFANLIVSERTLTRGDPPPPGGAVARALRPCGGAVCIAAPEGSAGARQLDAWSASLPEGRVDGGPVRRATARRGALPGSGSWTHFYADPANTACSGDELPPGPMDVQWFGRPGPATMVDRHKKGPAPLCADGRLFVPGFNYLAAVDAYNGFVLWERSIPDSVRVGAFKDSSSIATDGRHVFVAAGAACHVLDAESGLTRNTVPLPGRTEGAAWGYLAVTDGILVGSAARRGGSMRRMTDAEDEIIWRNCQPLVCSASVFAADPGTGRCLWTYTARRGLIPNPTLTIGGGRVVFVESGNAATLQSADGRVSIPDLVGAGARLVALDLRTGRVEWDVAVDLAPLEHVLFMSYASGTLLVTGSRYAEVDPRETAGRPKPAQLKRVRYDLSAFDAATGARRWTRTFIPNYDHVLNGAHGEQVQHPAIVGDVVLGPDFACHLSTGEPYAGPRWEKSHKCATLSTSRYCAFSRFSEEKLPYLFDLRDGTRMPLARATRPGCWINMIPAGGLLLIPEASAGCTCPYPFQTSVALIPAER
jgi:outer membrane protein assembly factor BamB